MKNKRSGVDGQSSKNLNTAKDELLFHSLLRTLGLLRHVMEPHFNRFGISGPQWGVLRVLYRAAAEGEPELRLTDVGQRLLIQPPSVTGVVDRLERLGLVERTDSKVDLRVRRLGLTQEGQKLVEQVLDGYAERVGTLFSTLTMEEQESLRILLQQLGTHLETLLQTRWVGPINKQEMEG